MNFSITAPSTEANAAPDTIPAKEPRSKDEKGDYLNKILHLEEKLKEYR